MGTVVIENVVKRFGSLETIRGVSIRVPDGSFTVLVGPSGCGKSTLLRMIAGLEDIDGGAIAIDGRTINEVAAKDRDIAMVFQNYALYPHMTVERNMGFSLWLAKVPKAEIRTRVHETARVLGLEPYLARYPRQLSGGQRQRVAMGRAIVRQPKVYLFDEPLSNLDAKLRVQMRAELRATHQRLKTTTIYVTHDQIEAMTMADQIVVMRAGAIEQIGAPLELYDRPANTFVAGFIGSPAMNLLRGRSDGEGAVMLDDATRIPVGLRLEPGHEVILGVRPEHVALAGEGAACEAVVTAVEPTGANTLVSMHLGEQAIAADLRERILPAAGERLALQFDRAHLHLFDARSEQRLN